MEGVVLYFENFHNQPYPLLSRLSSCIPQSVAELPPPIVRYPMLALSLRTSSHPFVESRELQQKLVRNLSEAAWQLLTQAYSKMDIGISYFQGLCLLAQVDFAGEQLPVGIEEYDMTVFGSFGLDL